MKRMALLLVAILLISVAGCAGQPGSKSTAANNSSQPAVCTDEPVKARDVKPEDMVTIYLPEKGRWISLLTLEYFIDQYNRKLLTYNQGIPVRIRKFANADEFTKTVTTELLAGGGPDLFYVTADMELSTQAFIEKGAFADLDGLIEKEKYFNLNDYYDVVMDAGVIDGKRLFLPVYYKILNTMWTTMELRQKYNIDLKNGIRYDNFAGLLTGYNNSRDKDTTNAFDDDWILYNSIGNFIDYSAKKASFDSPEFKKFIIDWQSVYSEKSKKKVLGSFVLPQCGALCNEACAFASVSSDVPEHTNIGFYYNYIANYYKKTPELIAMKDAHNPQGYAAEILDYVAINSNSKKADAAFHFVLELLRSEYQEGDIDSGKGFTFGDRTMLPVNKLVQQKALDELKNEIIWSRYDDTNGYALTVISEDVAQQYKEILNNVVSCRLGSDRFITRVFNPIYRDYKDGSIDMDTFIQRLQSKATIYLNE